MILTGMPAREPDLPLSAGTATEGIGKDQKSLPYRRLFFYNHRFQAVAKNGSKVKVPVLPYVNCVIIYNWNE